VTDTSSYLEAINERLQNFCSERRSEFANISPDLVPLVDFCADLLTGGKRFRALFAYWSWLGHRPFARFAGDPDSKEVEAMVGIGAALEMFHAAALVHDDLIDQSDTRRGKTAIHKRFEAIHENSAWSGSSERFGAAGAILVGDLMLGWSSELFGHALLQAPNPTIEAACRDEFSRMRVEVMAGQYLDVVEENAGAHRPIHESVARANQVMLFKTAKYSIEAPLLIGAAFAGATRDQMTEVSDFGIPLGLAFQLRDDILGVFGDPSVTGKPAGDDLREGKRTVLIAHTREALSELVGREFDKMLSSRDLSTQQIGFLQQTIRGSGALAKTEMLMNQLADSALSKLDDLSVSPVARQALEQLARKVVDRES
jgi:geranylgeranyl diphosphate synthase type I